MSSRRPFTVVRILIVVLVHRRARHAAGVGAHPAAAAKLPNLADSFYHYTGLERESDAGPLLHGLQALAVPQGVHGHVDNQLAAGSLAHVARERNTFLDVAYDVDSDSEQDDDDTGGDTTGKSSEGGDEATERRAAGVAC